MVDQSCKIKVEEILKYLFYCNRWKREDSNSPIESPDNPPFPWEAEEDDVYEYEFDICEEYRNYFSSEDQIDFRLFDVFKSSFDRDKYQRIYLDLNSVVYDGDRGISNIYPVIRGERYETDEEYMKRISLEKEIKENKIKEKKEQEVGKTEEEGSKRKRVI